MLPVIRCVFQNGRQMSFEHSQCTESIARYFEAQTNSLVHEFLTVSDLSTS